MTGKPVIRREAADRDVEAIVDHYLVSGGAQLALRFVDALELAVRHVARHPATGSPRYAQLLSLPGLRSWGLTGFPHLVFYFEKTSEIEIWRVLHGRADIADWLLD